MYVRVRRADVMFGNLNTGAAAADGRLMINIRSYACSTQLFRIGSYGNACDSNRLICARR